MADLDITKNIRIIEKLKSELLSGVAQLYESMLFLGGEHDQEALLADIVIKTYQLSKRLGTDYDTLDEKVIKKLRLAIIQNEDMRYDDAGQLLRHIERPGEK